MAPRALIGCAIYAVAFFTWQSLSNGDPDTRSAITNLAFVPVGIVALAFAIRAVRDETLGRRTRRAWTFLAAAFATFLAGDLAWVVFENVLGTSPFPSIADAFYLPFYPLMLAGLLSFPSDERSGSERTKFWLDAATVALGGWMVIWYLVLGPVAAQSGAPTLDLLLSIAYPVGDLLLVFGVAAVILRRPSAASRRAMLVLAAGAVVFVVADTAFGYLDFNGTYQSGSWPDSAWMLAQLSLVYAAAVQVSGRGVEKQDAIGRIGRTHASKLPYAAVGLGYGLLLIVAMQETIYPLGGLLVGAVATTGLVIARQITVLRDNARLLAELEELAVTDDLTGLRNRRSFMELAEREFEIAKRYERPLTAVMLDIDHFKDVNDSFGHEVGDAVLRSVGFSCLEQVRAGDLVGRHGGDELVLLLPGTEVPDAEYVAERICRTIEARPVRTGDAIVPVTISLGLATAERCTSLVELIRNADTALYAAKAGGRNRLQIARLA